MMTLRVPTIIAVCLFVAAPADALQSRGVYKTRIEPHWSEDSSVLWYVNTLRDGIKEYIRVDTASGSRSAAFDHQRLAKKLQDAGVEGLDADRLELKDLQFKGEQLDFILQQQHWSVDLSTYKIQRIESRQTTRGTGLQPFNPQEAPRASTRTGPETSMRFVNRLEKPIEMFWLTTTGGRRSYGRLAAGEEHEQHTYSGHLWQIVCAGKPIAVFQADEAIRVAEVSDDMQFRPPPRRSRGRNRRTRSTTSPDGKWSYSVRDGQVVVERIEDDKTFQLTDDADIEYGMLEWSPDSKTLAGFRIDRAETKEVHLIESSPRGGGRARLHTRGYALPGDPFTSYQLVLFDVPQQSRIDCDAVPVDFGRPRIRWSKDGSRLTYTKIDRGHQRLRLIEVDAASGDHRNLIDEQTNTFIWTAHRESYRSSTITSLENTDEIIYVSEKDGWRHLYLVDAKTAKFKNAITQGEYVVRGVDRIDEEQRQVWFRASGRNPDEDPYLIHHYRVNFDGSGLTVLTEGNGNHSLQYSPDGSWVIDTYSRVDLPPVHELRRTSDGKLVCQLEEADDSQLRARGWQPPEVFVAKGRDGKTDIWGLIWRPRNMDPEKKYPIIEDIYAGPHGSFVPKSFSSGERYRSLTDLGFVVVKLDGMGTANRSKKFHDVCWQNIKDHGFPDRIAWIRAAGKKYPYMDTSRVGIYGTSAGGQSAAAAVLFHADFYRVAVASCGCHDNRMDKASWNEQWMGYPVGPHYAASSNIDNAHRLGGQLLLIVGEMDTNVPPESTYRFADALIEADKDFDLIVLPGAGHTSGGAYGARRRRDFFVRHLLGKSAPDRN